MCSPRANPRTMLLGLLIWPNYFYQWSCTILGIIVGLFLSCRSIENELFPRASKGGLRLIRLRYSKPMVPMEDIFNLLYKKERWDLSKYKTALQNINWLETNHKLNLLLYVLLNSVDWWKLPIINAHSLRGRCVM